MQGVRTTRGCIGCRRRKKGCDLQKPCGRCQKLNLSCSYETRQFWFVDANSKSFSQIQMDTASTTWPSHSSLVSTDTTMLVDTAFWDLYTNQGDAGLDGRIDGIYAAPWISTVRLLATDGDYLQTTIHALCYAGLGWMRRDYSLIQRGLRLYMKALQRTNKILQKPESEAAQSDALLASCRILSLFEMYRRLPSGSTSGIRAQTTDWQSHILGSCRLIQLRGITKHCEGHGANLYDATRFTATIHGIARRQPNALTNPSWDVYQYRRKTLRDALLDIMCVIPDLYQQFDQVKASLTLSGSIMKRRAAVDLIGQFVDVSQRLQAWEARAIRLCEKQQVPANTRGSESTRTCTLMDVCTIYGDGFFYTCANYWATCLKVFPTARLLYQQLHSVPQHLNPQDFPKLPASMDPEIPARNLADTTWYFFRPTAGLMAAQSAVFPVGAALFYFARTGRRDSEVFKKMMDAFASANTGAVMLDFVRDIVDRA